MTWDQRVAALIIAASFITLGAIIIGCTVSARAERRQREADQRAEIVAGLVRLGDALDRQMDSERAEFEAIAWATGMRPLAPLADVVPIRGER